MGKREEVFYTVGVLRADLEVESNLPFKVPALKLKLKWANGMIGAIPVFRTREEAEEYAPGCQILALTAEVATEAIKE